MPFDNPVVAGTTLVIPAIKSDDYVAGVSGWAIFKDGTAEFNNVTVRGEVVVSAAANPFTYVRIYDNGSLDLPIIELASPIGRTFKIVAIHQTAMAIFADNLNTNVVEYFVQDRGIALVTQVASNAGVLIDAADGVAKYGSYSTEGTFNPEVWHTAIPVSGWTGTVEYKRLPDGMIVMRGELTGGTNTVGTGLIVAPGVGYRPTRIQRFESATGSINAGGRIQIDTAGATVIARVSADNSFWFDMVHYSVI